MGAKQDSPPFGADMRSGAGLQVPLQTLAAMVLVLRFTGAWIWPQELGGFEAEAQSGTIFLSYGAYLAFLFLLSCSIVRGDLVGTLFSNKLLLALVGWASVSAILGLAPLDSIRAIALFSLTIVAGIILGSGYDRRSLFNSLLFLFAVILVLSLFLSIAVPSIGESRGAARGAFTNKNSFGIMAAAAVVAGFVWRDRSSRLLAWSCVVLGLVSLGLSGARTSLAACIIGCGYDLLLKARIDQSARRILILLYLPCVALFVLYGFDQILELFGKDPTLTGRTVIWNLYINEALQRPLLGAGASMFSNTSPITSMFFEQLSSYGSIKSPHNVFVAMLGETGVPGLLLFMSLLLSIAFAPLERVDIGTRSRGVFAVTIATIGLGETLGGFSTSILWFMLGLALALGPEGSADAAG